MVRSLPFRLLAVNDVDVRDAGRHNWHQPGVVEDSEHEPLWRSPPNSSYPQELGLILLSVEPVTIKSVRVKVELTRTPARLEISVGRQKDVVASGHLDAVSRYFSADWTPSCEVLMWEARMDIPQAINPKAVRLDVSDCSFIRLVVHAPHESACNRSHEVVLEDIELLGLTGVTSCKLFFWMPAYR
ncbi:hypothetical protein KRP22_008833 [Phytophthora ramorum]|uniref:uncharacterized protein n=1 Tax=Phytophthora ramorum TaxID=164328 RepID=UPI0030A05DF8|nr:hypothetical protein KRP23_2481 [Phytophthora ramorum]KAH7502193.1 hypothetical protein KRP22_7664 [Phytophthora ramorum]